MNKNEYLARLRKALKGVSSDEADRLIEYYRELIDDGLENGGGEKFIASLEPPELVAQNFIRDNAAASEENTDFLEKSEKPAQTPVSSAEKEGKTPLYIKIPLMVLCVFVAFVGALVLGSVTMVGAAIAVSGAYAFIAAFAIFSSAGIAVAQIGFALALFAIGVAILTLMPYMWKLYVCIVRKLAMKKVKLPAFNVKTRWIAALGCVAVAGVVVFTAAFGALGFNGGALTREADMVARREVLDAPSDAFEFVTDIADLTFEYTDGEDIVLEFYEFNDSAKTCVTGDGKVTLNSGEGILSNVLTVWKHGVFFAIHPGKYYEAKIYIPREKVLSIDASVENGQIVMTDMTVGNLKLSTSNGAVTVRTITADSVVLTSSNGAVAFMKSTVTGSVTAKTFNGAVFVSSVTANSVSGETENGAVRLDTCVASKIVGKTSNGAVSISRIKGDEIDLYSGNGSIYGTVDGAKRDYRIESETGLGSNNLGGKTDGTKLLRARTGNGAINITFLA